MLFLELGKGDSKGHALALLRLHFAYQLCLIQNPA
jgi:hypothetical protein